MPGSNADGGERSQRNRRGVQLAAPAHRIERGGEREGNAGDEDADALKDAQRARLQMQNVLRVVRIPQERGTGEEAETIRGACRHRRRMPSSAPSSAPRDRV